MEQKPTLEEFADEVRKELTVIMSRCAFGHSKEAGALAAVLCARAVTILEQTRMAKEVESQDYDLSRLTGSP